MRPLRIVAEMTEPVITYGDGMHLDGILSWGAYLALPPDEREALPPTSASDWALDFDLGLERWAVEQPGTYDRRLCDDQGRVWGWRASAAHGTVLHAGKVEVRKRPPIAAFTRYTSDKSVLVAGGSHKAWDLAFPSILALEIEWYAVGDMDRVRSLLARVLGIGKRTNHGNGTVARWRVERWTEDWSTERGGQLTRRMPHAVRPSEPAGRGAIRPPYHHRSRLCPSVDPEPTLTVSLGAAR